MEPLADSPDHAARVTKAADRAGLDLVGIQDHPYQRRFLDTWTLISTLVPVTENVRFFPDVANLPLRPPPKRWTRTGSSPSFRTGTTRPSARAAGR